MIRPPWDGVAFSDAADGDIRNDLTARARLAVRLAIEPEWASVRQVHGSVVLKADAPGDVGEADAIWTDRRDLPVAVFTADCLGVALLSSGAVGVAHAGWRGAAAGVVAHLREQMSGEGHHPDRAAVGPGIGPCCFEVGPEVADRFDTVSKTSWGTTSVDLAGSVAADLAGIEVWDSRACTHHGENWFSHRRDATKDRLATVAWLT